VVPVTSCESENYGLRGGSYFRLNKRKPNFFID